MFHTDIASVCSKYFIHFRSMLQVYYMDVAYVSHRYCTRLFQIFYLFQTYIAASVFVVASVFMFQALNGTTRVTRRTSVGGGASAIWSRRRRSPRARYEAGHRRSLPARGKRSGVQAVPVCIRSGAQAVLVCKRVEQAGRGIRAMRARETKEGARNENARNTRGASIGICPDVRVLASPFSINLDIHYD
jgi:hypothetical protein